MAAQATRKPSEAQSKRASKIAQANVRANVTPEDSAEAAADPDSKPDGASESAYIKDLQRTIRNVTKKLAATQKVDTVVAENPNVSLDELVAQRKINTDQKAQALKKPQLQSQLAQLEEQIVQFRDFEEDTQRRFAAEKDELRRTYQEELEAARATVSSANSSDSDIRSKYLVLSRFLRAAAARRQSGEDETSEESQAFEGVLLLLYSGDTTAVDAMEKLVNGAEDKAPSTAGEAVNVSYARVKEVSLTYALEGEEDGSAQATLSNGLVGHDDLETDPTVANAGMTEMAPPAAAATGETDLPAVEQLAVSEGAGFSAVDEGAANAAGATTSSTGDIASNYIMVPRDTSEVESSWAGADKTATANWADEVPPTNVPGSSSTPSNDGFNEVVRNRGGRGGGGRGGYRGRGGPREGGDRRGRGGRGGDGRGRGGAAAEGGRGRGGRGGRGRGD